MLLGAVEQKKKGLHPARFVRNWVKLPSVRAMQRQVERYIPKQRLLGFAIECTCIDCKHIFPTAHAPHNFSSLMFVSGERHPMTSQHDPRSHAP